MTREAMVLNRLMGPVIFQTRQIIRLVNSTNRRCTPVICRTSKLHTTAFVNQGQGQDEHRRMLQCLTIFLVHLSISVPNFIK